MSTSHLHADVALDIVFSEEEAIHTVVQKVTDHQMSEMRDIFDSTFDAMGKLIESGAIAPNGPAFSLHHRLPTDSVTMDVGLPVASPLEEPVVTESGVVLEPSVIPAGTIARMSHIGSFDGLPTAWSEFMEAIAAAGKEPQLPFWEVYVTEPTPDMDPATLRTDLVSLITG